MSSLVLNLQLLVEITCIDSGGWHWTGWGGNSYFYSDVLKFDPSSLEWHQSDMGSMIVGRYWHGVSIVNVEDIEEYCN